MKRYIPVGIFLAAIFGAAVLGAMGVPVAEGRIDQLIAMLFGGGITAGLMCDPKPEGGA